MSEKGTEQATEQRKQKAKQQGDIVRSRELIGSAAMLAGLVTLGISARPCLSAWSDLFARTLQLAVDGPHTDRLGQEAVVLLIPAMLPVVMILATCFLAALFAGVAQSGGVQIRSGALSLKFDRLNPITGFGHLFSLRSMTRLAKSLLPAAVVVAMGIKAVSEMVLPMPVMSLARLPKTLNACFGLGVKAAFLMVVWSLFDYAMEWREWNQRLRMTKQEIKDEMKDTMGNPQVKGRIRRMQNAMRRRKVKADVSRASVVITNPTHYAVALEFSFELMQAPTVLIKGRNLHALHIREEAENAGVPIVENPPLARSLYKSVAEGQPIPFDLYAAVAGILAYLYRQQVEKAARDHRAAQERAMRSAERTTPVPENDGGLN